MVFGENEESVAQPMSSTPTLSFTTITTSTRASPLSSAPSSKSREGLALVLLPISIHWRLTTLFPSAPCLTRVKSRDWVQGFLLIEWKSLEESSRLGARPSTNISPPPHQQPISSIVPPL